jgi:hypothetical protein
MSFHSLELGAWSILNLGHQINTHHRAKRTRETKKYQVRFFAAAHGLAEICGPRDGRSDAGLHILRRGKRCCQSDWKRRLHLFPDALSLLFQRDAHSIDL